MPNADSDMTKNIAVDAVNSLPIPADPDLIPSLADATARGAVVDAVLGGAIPPDPDLAAHYRCFRAVQASPVVPLSRDRATGRAMHLLRKRRLLRAPLDRPFAADFGAETVLVVPQGRALTLTRYTRRDGLWRHDRCVVRFRGAEATVMCNPAHTDISGHLTRSQELARSTVALLLHWLLSCVEEVTVRFTVTMDDGETVEIDDAVAAELGIEPWALERLGY